MEYLFAKELRGRDDCRRVGPKRVTTSSEAAHLNLLAANVQGKPPAVGAGGTGLTVAADQWQARMPAHAKSAGVAIVDSGLK